jgi:AbrB family looped-hinge helix DNA binding protein
MRIAGFAHLHLTLEAISVILLIKMYNNKGKSMAFTAKVSTKGWVVIPIEIRKRYHIQPGDVLAFVDYGGQLSLIRVSDDPIAAGRGMLKGSPSLTQELLEEHRRELEHEEAIAR